MKYGEELKTTSPLKYGVYSDSLSDQVTFLDLTLIVGTCLPSPIFVVCE